MDNLILHSSFFTLHLDSSLFTLHLNSSLPYPNATIWSTTSVASLLKSALSLLK